MNRGEGKEKNLVFLYRRGIIVVMGDKSYQRWNPDDFWRLLRLSQQYRRAVDEFVAAAKRDHSTHGKRLLSRFETVSKETPYTESPDERKSYLRQPKVEQHFPVAFEEPYIDLARTPYGRKFLCWYGDIIRFPLHYAVITPNPDVLIKLWQLRPAYIAKGIYADFRSLAGSSLGEGSRFGSIATLTLVINPNFSHKQIAKSVAEAVSDWLKQHQGSYFKPHGTSLAGLRPKWSKLESSLQIIEGRMSGPKAKPYREIANQVLGLPQSNDAAEGEEIKYGDGIDRARKRLVEERFKYLKKVLAVFEREEPSPKFWRTKPKKRRS